MKKHILYFLFAFFAFPFFAEASKDTLIIRNLSAGHLGDSITAQGATAENVKHLTIFGQLNGTDIRLLRYMGGSNDVGNPMPGYSLETLILDSARIVAGGVFYIEDPNRTEHFTENDVLGMWMFFRCKNFKTVSTPFTIVRTDKEVFSECDSLRSVSLNTALDGATVSEGMFSFAGELNSVYLSPKITSIGNGAFFKCAELESVKLPDSLATIGESAFAKCTKLKSIVIPAKVTELGMAAFAFCLKADSLSLPEHLESIGVGAFQDCQSLKSMITIGENLEDIAPGAFAACANIPGFSVASGNPNYSSESGVLYNKTKTILIQYPGGRTGDYTAPAAVDSIADYAFYRGEQGPENVTIPSTVTKVGFKIFAENSALKTLNFQAHTKEILDGFAHKATSLTSVTGFWDSLADIGDAAFRECIHLRTIQMPKYLEVLGNLAFLWTNLDSIYFDASLNSIGMGVFGGSTLRKLVISPNNQTYCSIDNVVYSKDSTTLVVFVEGAGDSIYTVKPFVKKLGQGCFREMKQTHKVIIPNTVVDLGPGHTFQGSGHLREVVVSDSATQVPEAFVNACPELKKFNIPYKAVAIHEAAFLVGNGVEDIHEVDSTVPIIKISYRIYKNLEVIAPMAFQVMQTDTLIVDLVTPLDLPSIKVDGIDYDVFFHPDRAVLVVPYGSKTAYDTTEQWRNFGTILEMANITVKSNDTAKGSVSINKNVFILGDSVTITATTKGNNVFAGWLKSGSSDTIKQNPYKFAVSGNEAYTAYFNSNGTNVRKDGKRASFAVYPNPTSGKLRVENGEWRMNEKIKVYNSFGVCAAQYSSNNKETEIDLSDLKPGIYFIGIGNERVKIVKQ